MEKEDSKEEKEQVQVEGANYDGFRCLGCCNLESWQPELHLQWGTSGQPRSDLTFSHSDTADMIRVHAVAMMMKSRGLATGDFLYSEEHSTGCRHVKNARRDGGCLVTLVAFFIISMSTPNVFCFLSHRL